MTSARTGGSHVRTARRTRATTVAVATASAVLLTVSPAHPVAVPAAARGATAPATAPATGPAAAPAERPVSELLVALKGLYRQAESASEAFKRTERELREQQKLTAKLEKRLGQARVRLAAEQKEAARIARARYRTGALGLPPAVRVLLADDPVGALHYGHALRRAAAQQQAKVRALASGERHRGAVAAQARDALERQHRLADRKERHRKVARDRLRKVEELLVSLTPDQLQALRRLEQRQPGGGPPLPPAGGAPQAVGTEPGAGVSPR